MRETLHSIQIDEKKCVGCVLCMKACPTKAIRVQNNKAITLTERCVDCGACFRICPHEAIIPLTTTFSALEKYKARVAIPAPSLYTQFGWEIMPNQILLGLKKIGFDYVYDEAWMCEMVNAAITIYIQENPLPKPKISINCPAAVRIVTYLYPELVDHIIPIEVPRELAAEQIRKRICLERNIKPEEIGIVHITSCPATMISINRPIGIPKSNLDGAIAVRDIYGRLLGVIESVQEDIILQQSSGVGLGWAVTGGEAHGLNMDNCLSVSGVGDIIEILDDVLADRLRDVEYLECYACPAGCIGGPLNILNRHFAKQRMNNLIKMFGEKSRVSRKMVRRLYEEHFFDLEQKIKPHPISQLDQKPSKAIEKRRMMEKIIPYLGGKECGACGAPDCKTLARDIVLGKANLEDCLFLKKGAEKIGVSK